MPWGIDFGLHHLFPLAIENTSPLRSDWQDWAKEALKLVSSKVRQAAIRAIADCGAGNRGKRKVSTFALPLTGWEKGARRELLKFGSETGAGGGYYRYDRNCRD